MQGDNRLDDAAKCLQQLLSVLKESTEPFCFSPEVTPRRGQPGTSNAVDRQTWQPELQKALAAFSEVPEQPSLEQAESADSTLTTREPVEESLGATLPPGPFLEALPGQVFADEAAEDEAAELVAALNKRESDLGRSLNSSHLAATLRSTEDTQSSADSPAAAAETLPSRSTLRKATIRRALTTAESEASKLLKLLQQQEEELMLLKQRRTDEFSRLHTLLQRREEELAELRAQNLVAMAAAREKQQQPDTAAECLRLRGELASMRSHHEDELSRKNALLQTQEEELSVLKVQHAQELDEVHGLLRQCEADLAALKAQSAMPKDEPMARPKTEPVDKRFSVAEFDQIRRSLISKEEESLRLKSELHEKTFELQRSEARHEKELDDCALFVKRLAFSSSSAALEQAFDLSSAEFLGMGNYGYVLTCRTKKSGDRVVLKLQSDRWVGLAVSEWAHGSEVGVHPHIVLYIEALMHSDRSRDLKRRLVAAFDEGKLTGRRPRFFPDVFFCLALEYMDRGTVQRFMDKGLLTPTCVGAITRQIASALTFMHRKKRTHNDIKPENILLCVSPGGDELISKLADLGLANHSLDRQRDVDLFAYTVWCMGLCRDFDRCPAVGSGREEACARFANNPPSKKRDQEVWKGLSEVITGLWQGSWEMCDVGELSVLAGLKIKVPESKDDAVDLEQTAKQDIQKRTNVEAQKFQLRREHRTKTEKQLQQLKLFFADDEDKEEDESQDLHIGLENYSFAQTWPPPPRPPSRVSTSRQPSRVGA